VAEEVLMEIIQELLAQVVLEEEHLVDLVDPQQQQVLMLLQILEEVLAAEDIIHLLAVMLTKVVATEVQEL
jgi:hypothetical protein